MKCCIHINLREDVMGHLHYTTAAYSLLLITCVHTQFWRERSALNKTDSNIFIHLVWWKLIFLQRHGKKDSKYS